MSLGHSLGQNLGRNAIDWSRRLGRYVAAHPGAVVSELGRGLRNAARLRVGVPLEVLRFVAGELLQGKRAPKDVILTAAPPGLHVAATVDAMGTPVRVSVLVEVTEVDLGPESLRLIVRLTDLNVEVLGDPNSPVAGLIKGGAIDLRRPGNLIAFLPKKPAIVVEGRDDRIVVDLLRSPALKKVAMLRKLLAVLTPVVNVDAIETADDHLDLAMRANPARAGESFRELQAWASGRGR
jgi:hypothetical protein